MYYHCYIHVIPINYYSSYSLILVGATTFVVTRVLNKSAEFGTEYYKGNFWFQCFIFFSISWRCFRVSYLSKLRVLDN